MSSPSRPSAGRPTRERGPPQPLRLVHVHVLKVVLVLEDGSPGAVVFGLRVLLCTLGCRGGGRLPEKEKHNAMTNDA